MSNHNYLNFALAVDILLFWRKDDDAKILLIQRKYDPFKNMWAFPGGFVDPGELIVDAAMRELQEETGVTNIPLTRVDIFDAVHRDPRRRTLSVAHYAFVDGDKLKPQAADDARDAGWFSLSELPELAFDHTEILQAARTAAKL